ncbi:hypothetical protein [Sphingomonas sp.]|uniref:hypothetical protein n=1 Tax=Sphingomonas sp. TaxID=28214 RepID=UPI00260147D1|nr:hypothetical protein [Sphingomonas sp.]MBV9526928.1 hypothetical protein [Sphingomonas sp.]
MRGALALETRRHLRLGHAVFGHGLAVGEHPVARLHLVGASLLLVGASLLLTLPDLGRPRLLLLLLLDALPLQGLMLLHHGLALIALLDRLTLDHGLMLDLRLMLHHRLVLDLRLVLNHRLTLAVALLRQAALPLDHGLPLFVALALNRLALRHGLALDGLTLHRLALHRRTFQAGRRLHPIRGRPLRALRGKGGTVVRPATAAIAMIAGTGNGRSRNGQRRNAGNEHDLRHGEISFLREPTVRRDCRSVDSRREASVYRTRLNVRFLCCSDS